MLRRCDIGFAGVRRVLTEISDFSQEGYAAKQRQRAKD